MKKKIYVNFFIVIVLICIFLSISMIDILRVNYTDETIQDLKENAYIIEALLSNTNSTNYEEIFNNIFQQQILSGLRLTLIDHSGNVLYDSNKDANEMVNHNNRDEIKVALNGEIGQSIRFSTTLKKQMVYIAIPFESNMHYVSVIRTAFPLNNIYFFTTSISYYLLFVLLFGLLISAFFVNRLSNEITKPILNITTSAKRITNGFFGDKIYYSGKDEIGEMCDSFNQMNSYIVKKIENLEVNNNNLNSIFSSIQTSIIVLDKKKRIVYCNNEAEIFLGMELRELKNRSFIEFMRDYEINKFIDDFYNDKTEFFREFKIENKTFKFTVNKIEGIFNDYKSGIVLLIHDISEMKKLEKIRKDFVTNVTHELKTPLTSIKGYVEILKDENKLDEITKLKFLDIVEIEADRLTNLINEILFLSEVENTKGNISNFEVVNTINEVITLMQSISNIKNINLNYEFDNEIFITGDRNRFKQMIINLIDNAIKYSNENGEIRIISKFINGIVRINVIDNGIGIEKKHLDRLFERFYRTDKSRSRSVGGTGLGLAIVKHIVKNFNGDISVHSDVDKGTNFTILIPIKPF